MPQHVLIIVQNLPVPLDRRVWLEAQALKAAGYEVSVICPKGPGDPSEQTVDGVDIFAYRPAPQAEGFWGFAREFAYSWLRTAALSIKIWRRGKFDLIQACNPPDTYWLLARLWRPRRVKFVFDQHDLNPELFVSRFGRPSGPTSRLQQKTLLWLERQTYRASDHVISTNESYRAIAMSRGSLSAESVTVVRSGPDTRAMRPVAPVGAGRRGGAELLVYLGVMGPQDNVDVLIDVVEELVRGRGRTEVRLALLGFGDCLESLQQEVKDRKLEPWIEFTGRVGAPEICEYLSSADIGLSPDRKTPLNDVSTMNKTMEYMAYGLPSVSFDLAETRVSAGASALFVPDGDVKRFADAVEFLLDDPAVRVNMGISARRRAEFVLDWRSQAETYVGVFDGALGVARTEPMPELTPQVLAMPSSQIEINDETALSNFLRTRGRPERVQEFEELDSVVA
jgi:glycosyltransferase involved in cell wall biosynthesis